MFLPEGVSADQPVKDMHRYSRRMVHFLLLMASAPPVYFNWYLLCDDQTFVIPNGLSQLVASRTSIDSSVTGHLGCSGMCGAAGILFSYGLTRKLAAPIEKALATMSSRTDYVGIIIKVVKHELGIEPSQAYPMMSGNKPAPHRSLEALQAAATYHYVCCNLIPLLEKCLILNDRDTCRYMRFGIEGVQTELDAENMAFGAPTCDSRFASTPASGNPFDL
eukprot:gnl/TRDRNA2_/TRDRNA2_175489_c1_seq2.p1 gnl/TRDRNA2_/TRDRNA2_175489_c1~~gnl/TRDRNA2_/TRDRNA2_175489_c1_seq2.p1  ORF type:complete len:220 (+),score=17.62 gnl/TRDRNA2_/TRDRNA2_175489_c1_seq2:64-723(+)